MQILSRESRAWFLQEQSSSDAGNVEHDTAESHGVDIGPDTESLRSHFARRPDVHPIPERQRFFALAAVWP